MLSPAMTQVSPSLSGNPSPAGAAPGAAARTVTNAPSSTVQALKLDMANLRSESGSLVCRGLSDPVGWVERSEAHRCFWWASLRSTHPTAFGQSPAWLENHLPAMPGGGQ